MNVLDRAIAYLFPRWGFGRVAVREALRTYDAAVQDRTHARRGVKHVSPEEATRMPRDRVLALSRDLDRNNGWAAGLYNSIVANVVGDGIVPEARIRRPRAGDLISDANDLVEDAWSRWADGADINGRQSFYELEEQVERDVWIAGEILVSWKFLTGEAAYNRKVPLAIDLIEAEQLSTLDQDLPNNRRIVQGVEMDADGRVHAYHIWPNHPAESFLTATPERIPADRIIHLYKAQRAKSPRGVPRIAPVARAFSALAQYLDYELTRARVGSAWAFLLKRGGMFKKPGLKPTGEVDANDNALTSLEGGMVIPGGPDDDLKSAGPTWANSSFEQFVVLLLHHCAAGMNVSYEILARDYTRTNFSSARQSSLEDRKQWRPRQKFLVRRFGNPIFREFHSIAGLAGVAPFNRFPIGAIPLQWRTPGWDWIDPKKEVESEKIAVGCGFKSPQQIAAERGSDFYTVIDEIAEAKAYAEERGIDLSMWQKVQQAGVQTDDEGSTDEEASQEDSGRHLAIV